MITRFFVFLLPMLIMSNAVFAEDDPCQWDPCRLVTLADIQFFTDPDGFTQAWTGCVDSEKSCDCQPSDPRCSTEGLPVELRPLCPSIEGYSRKWCTTGGCAWCGCTRAQGHCFYYLIPKPEDQNCCKEDEQSGMTCCVGKKCPKDTVGNPINIISGENQEIETDLLFSTPHEKGFKFYRTYKSRSELNTTIGYGWAHNYNISLDSFFSPDAHAFEIVDESGRKHYFQDNTGSGIYGGIMSTQGYLLLEDDGTLTWYRPNGIQYTFNDSHQLIAKTDGNGNVQTLAYDTDGRLDTVTDQATGRSMGFVYNADDRIDHIIGPVTEAVPDGIWVTYQYDTDGNLVRVIYADDNNGSAASGFGYQYEDPYDAHNITEKRNLAGEFLSSWLYDSYDRA